MPEATFTDRVMPRFLSLALRHDGRDFPALLADDAIVQATFCPNRPSDPLGVQLDLHGDTFPRASYGFTAIAPACTFDALADALRPSPTNFLIFDEQFKTHAHPSIVSDADVITVMRDPKDDTCVLFLRDEAAPRPTTLPWDLAPSLLDRTPRPLLRLTRAPGWLEAQCAAVREADRGGPLLLPTLIPTTQLAMLFDCPPTVFDDLFPAPEKSGIHHVCTLLCAGVTGPPMIVNETAAQVRARLPDLSLLPIKILEADNLHTTGGWLNPFAVTLMRHDPQEQATYMLLRDLPQLFKLDDRNGGTFHETRAALADVLTEVAR